MSLVRPPKITVEATIPATVVNQILTGRSADAQLACHPIVVDGAVVVVLVLMVAKRPMAGRGICGLVRFQIVFGEVEVDVKNDFGDPNRAESVVVRGGREEKDAEDELDNKALRITEFVVILPVIPPVLFIHIRALKGELETGFNDVNEEL